MTPRTRKLYSFWIDPEQVARLKAIKERDGIPESEAIRRAIAAWLDAKEANAKKPTRPKK